MPVESVGRCAQLTLKLFHNVELRQSLWPTCSIINQQCGQHFNEPTEKLRTQEEKRQEEGERAESKRLRHLQCE